MALLGRGYVVAGSLFLPSATAASEMVAIAVLREVYCRVAWPHRSGGTGAVPGDQLYIPVPIAVTAIHGSSECMRLAAVLAGAMLGMRSTLFENLPKDPVDLVDYEAI